VKGTDQAWRLLELHRYDEAVEAAARAAILDPTDPLPYELQARAYLGMGDLDAARRAADRALELGPDRASGHLTRVTTLSALGRDRAALRAAESAVAIDPELPEAHHALTIALLRCHRVRRAERAAERCLELAPDSTIGLHAATSVALHRQRWREAEVLSRRALALDPEDARAHHTLGVAVASQFGRRYEGLDELATASRLDPYDSSSRKAMRWVGHGGVLAACLILVVGLVRRWISNGEPETLGDGIAAIGLVVGLLVVGLAIVDRVRSPTPGVEVPRQRISIGLGVAGATAAILAVGWLAWPAQDDLSDPAAPRAGSRADLEQRCIDYVNRYEDRSHFMVLGSTWLSPSNLEVSGTTGFDSWTCFATRDGDRWTIRASPGQ
jgi:tetratricopeptide (TPR) repeat protein